MQTWTENTKNKWNKSERPMFAKFKIYTMCRTGECTVVKLFHILSWHFYKGLYEEIPEDREILSVSPFISEDVMFYVFIIFLFFRWGIPAASAELHGETLPRVWELWWEQAQLHSHIQWICESLGLSLWSNVTPKPVLKECDIRLSDSFDPILV